MLRQTRSVSKQELAVPMGQNESAVVLVAAALVEAIAFPAS